MKKLLLMKTQRNQVLEELKAQGLSVSEFEWIEVQKNRIPMVADEGIVSVLTHKPTEYCFCSFVNGLPTFKESSNPQTFGL